MPSPPRIPEIQTVAGATQFDGLTPTTGLVQFDDILKVDSARNTRVIVWSFCYNETGAGTTTVLTAFLRPADSSPASAILPLVIAETLPNRQKVISFGRNGLLVPRDQTNGEAFDLVVTTASKAATASIIVDFSLVRV